MYVNFCRVTGTPEELIIDFGLNPQPFGVPTEPIVITQRIVTNYYTAKRMLQALHMTIQRHEAAFGVLETDVQKRAHPTAMGTAPRLTAARVPVRRRRRNGYRAVAAFLNCEDVGESIGPVRRRGGWLCRVGYVGQTPVWPMRLPHLPVM